MGCGLTCSHQNEGDPALSCDFRPKFWGFVPRQIVRTPEFSTTLASYSPKIDRSFRLRRQRQQFANYCRGMARPDVCLLALMCTSSLGVLPYATHKVHLGQGRGRANFARPFLFRPQTKLLSGLLSLPSPSEQAERPRPVAKSGSAAGERDLGHSLVCHSSDTSALTTPNSIIE